MSTWNSRKIALQGTRKLNVPNVGTKCSQHGNKSAPTMEHLSLASKMLGVMLGVCYLLR